MGTEEISNMMSFLNLIRFDRLILVALGFVVLSFIGKGIRSLTMVLQHQWPSYRVIFLQIGTIIGFSLYIGGGIFLVYAGLQPPQEILIAILGSAAVAIGFSLKDIISSVVAGVILLFDRPFQMGDHVQFGDVYGEISGIGLRTVKITTLDDSLVTVPNSRFLTDVVSSGNAGQLDMMVVTRFYVALDADFKEIKEIIREVLITSRFVYLQKPIFIQAKEVEIALKLALCIITKAYVLDCRFERAFESDIVERVEAEFVKRGIKRPS